MDNETPRRWDSDPAGFEPAARALDTGTRIHTPPELIWLFNCMSWIVRSSLEVE